MPTLKIWQKLDGYLKRNFILIGILALAFSLRLYGIYFDYPNGVNNIWDEIFTIVYLFDAAEHKNLFIYSYQYPFLLPWLYIPGLAARLIYLALSHGAYSVDALKDLLVSQGLGQAYIVVRWYSVIFGTATVFLIYKIGRLIYKNKVSSHASAMLYSLSLLPVFLSHWGKAHVMMVFFLVLSLYWALLFEEKKTKKYFYWSLISAAASFSIHYIGASAIIFPLIAYFQNLKYFKTREFFYSALIYLTIAGFFYLANYQGIRGMIANNAGYFEGTGFTGMAKVGFLERFYYIFRDLLNFDPVPIVIFVFSFLIFFKKIFKNPKLRYPAIGLVFNYIFTISIIAWPQMIRWLLIFFTLSSLLGIGLIIDYLKDKKIRSATIYAGIILFCLPGLVISWRWDSLLPKNTRLEAAGWIEKNTGTKIVYSFDQYLDAPLSYEATFWNKVNNQRNSKKIDYILNHKDQYSGRGVNLFYDFNFNRYKDLGGKDTAYIIISYQNEQSSFDQKSAAENILTEVRKYHRLELVKLYEPLNAKMVFAKEDLDYLNNPLSFNTLMKLKKNGPFIEIFKVID